MAIWKCAAIAQERQVPWWHRKGKEVLPLQQFLAMDLSRMVLPAIEAGFAASVGAVRTSSPAVTELLYTLCVDWGFCLPFADTQRILNDPPSDAEAFTEAVYRAEGMGPNFRPDQREKIRAFIAMRLFPSVVQSLGSN